MTTPGGGDFGIQGDDTVAARISVDLPDEAVQRLHQLSQATADIQANMQATVRASGDYMDYLRQLPQVLQDAEAAAARFGAAAGGALGVTGSAVTAPGGEGRNDARSTSSLWPETPGGSNRRDVMEGMQAQLDELRRTNPRQYANLAAQQSIDQAGRRSVDDRVIGAGGEDRSDTLAPPAPRRRPSTPGDGNRRPPNRTGSPDAPSGGGSPAPGNRNTPGRGGGDGRPNPSANGETDWLARAQEFQKQTSSFLGTIYAQTAQGGRIGILDMATTGISSVRSTATRFQQQQEQRAAQAQAEAEAMAARAADPEDPTTSAEAAQAAAAAASVAGRASALGNTAKLALKGAGIAGVAVGGAMAVQSGGQWYQQHAAQGMQRGGGFSEGMGFEMQARTMALNPFISMEQSRKIMQSALQEGYTGKEFDTVTEFMAQNLQKMNIDVATSVKTLREQVEKGGQSLESVQTDLLTAQQMSKNPDSRLTAGEYVENYQRGTETGIEAGAGGQESGQYGLLTAGLFADDPVLAKVAPEAIQGAVDNSWVLKQQINSRMGMEGVSLEATVAEALSRPEGASEMTKAVLGTIEDLASDSLAKIRDNPNDMTQMTRAVSNFHAKLKANKFNFSVEESRALLMRIMNTEGGLVGEVDAQQAELDEAATSGGAVEDQGFWDKTGAQIGTVRHAAGGIFGGIAEGLGTVGSALGLGDGLKNWGSGHADKQRQNMAEDYALTRSEGMNSRVKSLIEDESTYAGDIKVKDAEGNEMSLLDATQKKEVLEQLVGGSAQIRMPDSETFTALKDLSAQQAGAEGGGVTLIELSESAQEYFRLNKPDDRRNQNQRSADRGEDGAARNDPPAGLGFG